MTTLYTPDFYRNQADNSYRSARIILPIVLEKLRSTSLIDVGCGVGTWMAAAKECGVTTIRGLEGSWIENVKHFRPNLDIRVGDLEQPIKQDRRFDLAICMEVAEHLSAQRAESLVRDLCNLSDSVLFGAAIPAQPGVGHINCQWQSYWAALFRKNGRVALDPVRPAVWGNQQVSYWYQQNPLLYVMPDRADLFPRPVMLDFGHPEVVALRERSLLNILKEIPSAFTLALRRRI